MAVRFCLSMIVVIVAFMVISTDAKEMSMKCQPNDKQLEVGLTCITKVTGSSEPEVMAKAWEDENTKEKIEECVFTAMEIISGSGFHEDKFEKMINEMNATDEIKKELVSIMEKCVAKHDKSKAKEILECMEDDGEKVCTDKTKQEARESRETKPTGASSLQGKSSTASPLMKHI